MEAACYDANGIRKALQRLGIIPDINQVQSTQKCRVPLVLYAFSQLFNKDVVVIMNHAKGPVPKRQGAGSYA